MEDTEKAVSQVKPGKWPGAEGTQLKWISMAGRQRSLSCSTCSFYAGKEMFSRRTSSTQSSSLCSKTREKSNCTNYCGITLLSTVGKRLARILLSRLIPSIIDGYTPESHCGFRANRGTTDIWSLCFDKFKRNAAKRTWPSLSLSST